MTELFLFTTVTKPFRTYVLKIPETFLNDCFKGVMWLVRIAYLAVSVTFNTTQRVDRQGKEDSESYTPIHT